MVTNYYQAGLARMPAYYAGRARGTWPPAEEKRMYAIGAGGLGGTGLFADTLSETMNIDSEFEAMNSEMFRQLPADLATSAGQYYTTAWNVFSDDWRAFRDKSLGTLRGGITALSPFLTRELWKDLQDYRGKLVEHRERAEKAGFHFTGPKPTHPKKDIFDNIRQPFGDLWDTIKTILYVGLFLVGGFLVWQVIRDYRHG